MVTGASLIYTWLLCILLKAALLVPSVDSVSTDQLSANLPPETSGCVRPTLKYVNVEEQRNDTDNQACSCFSAAVPHFRTWRTAESPRLHGGHTRIPALGLFSAYIWKARKGPVSDLEIPSLEVPVLILGVHSLTNHVGKSRNRVVAHQHSGTAPENCW